MRIILLIACLIWAATAVRAERYMTVAEAQKLCFPQADRFTERIVRFGDGDVEKIKAKSGVPVKNEGNRLVLAYAGEEFVGTMVIDHVLGKHEIIDYAVAISPQGKVLQVEILEYRESYGFEIRSPKWRKQFTGKNASSSLKLNRDIYNISGATMSCRHVSEGMKRVLATYELLCVPLLAGGGGLSHASATP